LGRDGVDVRINYKRHKYLLELKIWGEPKKLKAGLDQLKKHCTIQERQRVGRLFLTGRRQRLGKKTIFWAAKQIGGLTTHIVGRSLYLNTTALLKACWLC
jgi:hypothetical protein